MQSFIGQTLMVSEIIRGGGGGGAKDLLVPLNSKKPGLNRVNDESDIHCLLSDPENRKLSDLGTAQLLK